jgi:hypothetical protein
VPQVTAKFNDFAKPTPAFSIGKLWKKAKYFVKQYRTAAVAYLGGGGSCAIAPPFGSATIIFWR